MSPRTKKQNELIREQRNMSKDEQAGISDEIVRIFEKVSAVLSGSPESEEAKAAIGE